MVLWYPSEIYPFGGGSPPPLSHQSPRHNVRGSEWPCAWLAPWVRRDLRGRTQRFPSGWEVMIQF